MPNYKVNRNQIRNFSFPKKGDRKPLHLIVYACHHLFFDIKGELVAANDQHFSGASVSSAMAYSMIGLTLCFEKWIYVQNDD
ncbi:MAG: hypothetical protein IKY68_02670, partial [Alistipes sp.]|nr:hypothetical protein [Alistipes sp.]